MCHKHFNGVTDTVWYVGMSLLSHLYLLGKRKEKGRQSIKTYVGFACNSDL
jgi:hypothetical protein